MVESKFDSYSFNFINLVFRMKKSFFSSVLFGLLVMGTAGTVSSCKDYDDDINNLQTQIDNLNKLVKDLQTKIESGSVITSVTPTTGGVQITLSDGKSYTITNGKDGATGAAGKDGKDGTVWTIGTDGFWYKDGAKTDYYALGTKGDKGDTGATGATGAAGKDGAYYVPNATTGMFEKHNADGSVEQTNISFLTPSTVTAVKDADYLKLYNVKGATGDPIVIALNSHLKALVFDPDFYYQGIEAFDFNTFNIVPKTVKKVNADGDFKTDAPVSATASVTTSPDLSATYFLNPSNAKMSADASKYSFVAYNNRYTRAGKDVSKYFNIHTADLAEAGKVTVRASYNGNVIRSIANDDSVTVLALQYTSGDSVVTSDFAAVRANTYKNLVLNNPKHEPQADAIPSWLYQTAQAAIDNDQTVVVAWNNDKGIDLREYVNTRYQYVEADGAAGVYTNWDKNAAAGTVEKSGYKYSFELVGWHHGANVTSESAHAALAADGYTLRPQMPKDGKQQAYAFNATTKNNQQNQASIDREPLVRVILTDTINNKIAAVGYIKVKIVAENEVAVDPELYTIDIPAVTTPYTIACGDENAANLKLTWWQVEEQIIAKLAMSKADFEANYILDDNTADALQFDKNTANATALDAAKKLGVVAQTTADVQGTMTEVLTWTVKNQQAYTLYKAGKTSLSTYVRFKKIGTKGKYDYFYVKFTWTPSAINMKPVTTFGNENKIQKYWYAADNAVAGTGFADIHGNVEVVGTTDNVAMNGATTDAADDEYVFDVKNTLVGNKLSVNPLVAPYAGLNAGLNLTFGFVDGKGLYASADGTKVYAEKTLTNEVASIDPLTGIITYAQNDVAKKMLNAYDHTDLAHTVTAVVAVKATICDNISVPVNSNTFNVKFLRPIDVNDANAMFEDAETNGSDAALNLTFVDWRNHNFTDVKVTKGQNYWEYYGVNAIALDMDNATSDLNGNRNQKLADITSKVKLTYAAPSAAEIAAGKFGTLHYENNGLTVGQFHVYIPAKVTYDWGTINTTVICTIGKTQANAKRH